MELEVIIDVSWLSIPSIHSTHYKNVINFVMYFLSLLSCPTYLKCIEGHVASNIIEYQKMMMG